MYYDILSGSIDTLAVILALIALLFPVVIFIKWMTFSPLGIMTLCFCINFSVLLCWPNEELIVDKMIWGIVYLFSLLLLYRYRIDCLDDESKGIKIGKNVYQNKIEISLFPTFSVFYLPIIGSFLLSFYIFSIILSSGEYRSDEAKILIQSDYIVIGLIRSLFSMILNGILIREILYKRYGTALMVFSAIILSSACVSSKASGIFGISLLICLFGINAISLTWKQFIVAAIFSIGALGIYFGVDSDGFLLLASHILGQSDGLFIALSEDLKIGQLEHGMIFQIFQFFTSKIWGAEKVGHILADHSSQMSFPISGGPNDSSFVYYFVGPNILTSFFSIFIFPFCIYCVGRLQRYIYKQRGSGLTLFAIVVIIPSLLFLSTTPQMVGTTGWLATKYIIALIIYYPIISLEIYIRKVKYQFRHLRNI